MNFSDDEREAVYRVIRARRDIRRFRSEAIPPAALQNILRAAAQAPSVGYMQPWNFILVRDRATRGEIHDAFTVANREARELFSPDKAARYDSLKLEGILESDLNICVTCDRSRFGPTVLGRTSQPDMDIYSAVCAVQNLWLAARAEGIGVGWVSILRTEDLRRILRIPETVVPVAFLCVGYPESFPAEPELKTERWLPEVPLSEMIYRDRWGEREC